MAHFSEDPELLRVFREGLDPHLITAQAIFGQDVDPHGDERGIGKTVNFAIGYGAGAKKVAQVLSLAGYPTDVATTKEYLALVQGFYRGYYRWSQRTKDIARRKGSVRTMGGRRRRLKSAFKDTANWKLVGYGERQAVNSIIQGSAADIIRRTMVHVTRYEPDVVLLAQVHDELIFEDRMRMGKVAEVLKGIEYEATVGHGFDLRVPLLFSPQYTDTWAAKGDGVGYEELVGEEGDDETADL